MEVLLIDDHALFRLGVQELLERRGIQVTVTGNSLEEIAITESKIFDVILLDLRMPENDGLSLLKIFRQKNIKSPVTILTTSRQDDDIVNALKNGAQGYLLKDMEPDDLINALEKIVRGETVVAQELTSILAKAVQGETQGEKPKQFSLLTPRELEITCLLASGQSNKVIAKGLGISDGTVKLHVKAILRKLDVNSRVEAAVLAVRQDICNQYNSTQFNNSGF
ncbi:MAG: response regulator [Methylococcales bacterium]|jgi:two-component system nitrate/nitrite response regulator NarL|nr:response regulator [Methylococcales bacterium]MBT7411338.1 response regulator [Methylococcales bacterium]